MKKSRIFMAAGGFILAISAIFATKANKKFNPGFRTAFLDGSTSDYVSYGSSTNPLFTTRSGSGFVDVYYMIYTSPSTTTPGKSIAGSLTKSGNANDVMLVDHATW